MSASWWYPRPSGDSGSDRHAASIHVGCSVLTIAFAAVIMREFLRSGHLLLPETAGALAALTALALNYLGKWNWAARVGTYGMLFAVAFMVTGARDGFRTITMLAFPGLLLIGVMLLRASDYVLLACVTLLTVTGLGLAEIHGLVPTVPIMRTQTDYPTIFFVDLILVVIAIFGGLLARDARLNLAALRATVDELALANRELGRSEAKYRSFIELAVDAIFVVNRGGTILEVNRQASVLTGLPSAQLLNSSMTTMLAAVEPDGNPLPLDALAQGVPVMRPCRIRRPDGSVVEAEIHSAMLPEGLILCFCRDITERKRTEEDRKEIQAQLIQAQKMESNGRLAGGIAHDFNNLLTVINGYSRLLLDAIKAGDPNRESIEVIHQAGARAAGLTQQLLAFSGKQILQPRVLDLNLVVTDMRWMLTRLLGEDVELHIELSPEPAMICADLQQFEQVIMNLTMNARDALPAGGRVRIQTTAMDRPVRLPRSHPEAPAGRYVMLAVNDNGLGMDEETRRHIFEPFFTTKPSGKGTGLGLSMTRGIVEQSGGYIEVDSKPGRGTNFRILLQVADAPTDSVELKAPATSRCRETVLVVEDQTQVRKYTAKALESYGYHVIQAESAGEALAMCERERTGIDLVLTDVIMPAMSGGELADQLAKQRPRIKVLFMSGHTDDVIMHHGVLKKGTEIVQKPFSPETLASKVQQMLAAPACPARILVADDEPGVRTFLRKVLEGRGYEVIEAANGKEAVKQVRSQKVDLLITDLVMPEQEGIETIIALRGEAAGIGIIAISGAFGGRYLDAARQLGAHSVLTKPVSAEVLLAKVAEVLKTSRKE